MRSWRLRVALALALAWGYAQLFHSPDRTNGTADPAASLFAHVDVPAPVEEILRRSCFDCHSQETEWPWYSRVVPAAWIVAHDVDEGRRKLDFSQWSALSDYRAQQMLDAICGQCREGEMPLSKYLWLHRGAGLDKEDIGAICSWATQERDRIRAELEAKLPDR